MDQKAYMDPVPELAQNSLVTHMVQLTQPRSHELHHLPTPTTVIFSVHFFLCSFILITCACIMHGILWLSIMHRTSLSISSHQSNQINQKERARQERCQLPSVSYSRRTEAHRAANLSGCGAVRSVRCVVSCLLVRETPLYSFVQPIQSKQIEPPSIPPINRLLARFLPRTHRPTISFWYSTG